MLFSPSTGFWAALFYSLSPNIWGQSDYYFQPFIMSSFVYAGYYYFVLSLLKKRFVLLLFSIGLISLAVAVHNSAFGIVPVFLSVSFLLLVQQGMRVKYILGSLFAFWTLLFSYFLPTWISVYR